MTTLAPMSQVSFDQYLKEAVVKYAESNVSSNRWPKAGAIERSQAAYAELLPQGLKTPNNFLFEIKADAGSETIGILWYAILNRNGMRTAFVYDVFVYPQFRKQGHATQAFNALEKLVSKQGFSNIGLHVFSFNKAAQALYAKLGYSVTGIHMIKHLDGDGA